MASQVRTTRTLGVAVNGVPLPSQQSLHVLFCGTGRLSRRQRAQPRQQFRPQRPDTSSAARKDPATVRALDVLLPPHAWGVP